MPASGLRQARPVWAVEFDDRARRELRKLDAKAQKVILRYLRERIAGSRRIPDDLASRFG